MRFFRRHFQLAILISHVLWSSILRSFNQARLVKPFWAPIGVFVSQGWLTNAKFGSSDMVTGALLFNGLHYQAAGGCDTALHV